MTSMHKVHCPPFLVVGPWFECVYLPTNTHTHYKEFNYSTFMCVRVSVGLVVRGAGCSGCACGGLAVIVGDWRVTGIALESLAIKARLFTQLWIYEQVIKCRIFKAIIFSKLLCHVFWFFLSTFLLCTWPFLSPTADVQFY